MGALKSATCRWLLLDQSPGSPRSTRGVPDVRLRVSLGKLLGTGDEQARGFYLMLSASNPELRPMWDAQCVQPAACTSEQPTQRGLAQGPASIEPTLLTPAIHRQCSFATGP